MGSAIMKRHIETTTINYLDAYPGVGKTTIAIDLMIKAKDKVCVYVAPRHILLKEVEKRLRARVEYLYQKGLMPPEEYDRFVSVNHKRRRGLYQMDEAEAKKASTTVGTLLQRRVDAANPGELVFCTHENFVRNGLFQRDLSDIFVVFDEARKMVMERKDQRITFSKDQKEALFNSLEAYRSPVYYTNKEGERKYSGFSRYQAPEEDVFKIFKKATAIMHGAGDGVMDTSPSSAFQALVDDICNPKLDVYLKIPLELGQLIKEGPDFESLVKGKGEVDSVFQIISPAKLFMGYKQVLVMSAYFRQSQMFHLLSNYENIHPESNQRFVLEPLPLTEKQIRRIQEQKKLIESRFRQVRIFPLLTKEQKVSMTNLDMSCLVPREKLPEFYAELEKRGVQRNQVGAILTGRNPKGGRGSVQKHRMIRKVALLTKGNRLPKDDPDYISFERHGYGNPVVGYIRMAQHVVFSLTKVKYAVEKRIALGGRPLISMNRKHLEEMNREPNEFGDVQLPTMRSCINEPDALELQAELDKRLPYEDRIYGDTGHHFRVRFDLLFPDPMGLNVYRERNCIAYLSARNPSPDVAMLFKALTPEYDADDDYAGDSAVQAATRLSVRDQRVGERVYIIVPDLGLARIIKRKLRPYKNGEVDPDGEGAKIILKYAKKLDYVDVLTDLKETGYEAAGEVRRNGYAEEIKRWPRDVLAAHRKLANPEEVSEWANLMTRKITSVQKAELAMRKTKAFEVFVEGARRAVHEDLSLKYLNRVLQSRTSKNAAARYAEKRREAMEWLDQNLSLAEKRALKEKLAKSIH